ncbi:MAG: RluA family pseudouridine synthase [Clostridia bacterium]|jgi:23S rRNA pseudouridine1911/1915/1917 synthase|nr:RluA family pseudouridine synthase [Clostridia bacterium]
MDKRYFTAEEDCSRVDVFLSERVDLTRSSVKKLIDGGNASINGKIVKAGQAVKALDGVELNIPDPQPIDARPEDIPLDIVYEDGDIAVINKARGMTVHAGNGNTEGTLVNALLFRLDSLSGINGAIRPGIVHRIDKDTTGLLVVAKNDKAHVSLSKQIAEKTCKREYLALLEGVLKADSGTVATDLGRDPSDRLKMAVLPAGQGRYAETEYFAEERFAKNTLARFSLRTGRTHQIRVHAKYLGHPVVGDPVYGYKKQRFALQGQLLHAFKLELTHPKTEERMAFTAPLPADFERILQIVRRDV